MPKGIDPAYPEAAGRWEQAVKDFAGRATFQGCCPKGSKAARQALERVTLAEQEASVTPSASGSAVNAMKNKKLEQELTKEKKKVAKEKLEQRALDRFGPIMPLRSAAFFNMLHIYRGPAHHKFGPERLLPDRSKAVLPWLTQWHTSVDVPNTHNDEPSFVSV